MLLLDYSHINLGVKDENVPKQNSMSQEEFCCIHISSTTRVLSFIVNCFACVSI